MTIGEAITYFDGQCENGMTEVQKVNAISHLDGRIHSLTAGYYEGTAFGGYSDYANLNTPLLVGFPYDDLYVLYLASLSAMYDGDSVRYENYSALYNSRLKAYLSDYSAKHSRKSAKIRLGE